MKKVTLLLIVLVLLATPTVAHAQEVDPSPSAAVDDYLAALGLGPVIALVVQALKRFLKVPDGQAGHVALITSAVAYALALGLGMWSIDLEGDTAQVIIGLLSGVATLVLPLVSSVATYRTLQTAEIKGFRK